MFKSILDPVWAFDAEWVPDPKMGRILHHMPDSATDAEVMAEMWKQGGATPEDPTPFLKTALCRFVSIAMVSRQTAPNGKKSLNLLSLPRNSADPEQVRERHILETFLRAVGDRRPQLVGFNSHLADIKAMIQRSVILGVQATKFCHRPNKPWEGVDYFIRGSEWHVDLRDILSGAGRGPSLHEMAVQSGIPGKMDVEGNQVPQIWLTGQLDKIIAYNEFDALTTYLLWLRVAHFAGHLTTPQYEEEQKMVEDLLLQEGENGNKPHLLDYLKEWRRLQAAVA